MFSSLALAQNVDPVHFQPAPTLDGTVTVRGGATLDHLQSTLSAFTFYSHKQLVLVDTATNEELAAPVRHRIDLALSYAMGFDLPGGFLPGIDVAAIVPFVLLQRGEAFSDGVAGGTETNAGIADPRLQVRVGILSRERFGIDLAFVPTVTFPLSAGGGYFGNGSVTFAPDLAASTEIGPLLLAANLGYKVRGNQRVHDIAIEDQWTWRLGGGLALEDLGAPKGMQVTAEAYGLLRATAPFESARQSPTEVALALRQRVSNDFVVTVGGGSGITPGYGAPLGRAFLGFAWAPEPEVAPAAPPPPPPPPAIGDTDGDGLLDDVDACPLEPEDKDGFEDEEGCPDPDNDQDGILDASDQCPLVPEDKDGFEDEDGCPETDNDQDGIVDTSDACPLEPEDKDGFNDEDGCPEEDNDGDGIWDAADKCPNEAEVINGVDDADGCPDKGAELVKLTADKIEIKEAIYFATNSDVIESRSFGLLDQVAAVLKNHANILKVRVEGHTDDRGDDAYNLDLSQKRASSVVRYLVEKGGIQESRLEPVGFGETKPISTNKTKRGRDTNRRVEFNIVEQEGR